MILPFGSTNLTGDGVVGTSGRQIRLMQLIVRAGSGGATVVQVYNGASAGGTKVDTIDAATSTTTSRIYAGGLMLSSGCFIDLDTNTTFVTAIYAEER